MYLPCGDSQASDCRQQRRVEKQMTVLTIAMNLLKFCLPIGFVRMCLVLMHMVAKMRRRPLLMLAVDGRR